MRKLLARLEAMLGAAAFAEEGEPAAARQLLSDAGIAVRVEKPDLPTFGPRPRTRAPRAPAPAPALRTGRTERSG